jgi:predicted RNA-binding protein with TRAM domain
MCVQEMGRFDMNQPVPVREGEEIDVTIEAVGEKGDGIAKKNGFVLFVAGTQVGDRKRIKVTKVLKSVGFAEVIGDAQGAPESAPKQEKAPEPEFDPEEDKDSEDFGEEAGDESSDEDPEENSEEEPDEDDAAEEADVAPEKPKE